MTVLDYFKQISRVPRGSGNEEGIRNFLISWSDSNGFAHATDSTGNLIIYRNATPGYEDKEPLALQGHMDMVCVKKTGSNHDFTKDPIETVEKDGFLYAKETSLGADNGIAIATVMALFTDPDAQHGPLEAIFTVSEETSLKGAFGLDPSLIKSRRLLNLDSEEEGVIYTGCAGGADIKAKYTATLSPVPEDMQAVYLKVYGLKGGHSGGEIHRQRANAIRILAAMLDAVNEAGYSYMLSSFAGGERHNVIPYSAECVICVKADEKKEIVHNILMGTFKKYKAEYAVEDPDMDLEHYCSQHEPELKVPSVAIDCKTSASLIQAIVCMPHGVRSFSKVIKGVVKTSDNLAIVRIKSGIAEFVISVRSLSEFSKSQLLRRIHLILTRFGFETTLSDDYPAWSPNANSQMCNLCAKVWKEMTGKDAVITSIHAGLECGVINSKIEGMDSVSTGPDLFDVHSTREHLSIESAERLYDFVKRLVKY